MSRTPGTDAAKELSKLMARNQLDDSGALNSMLVVLVDELGGIRDELGGIRDTLIAEKRAHAKLRAELADLMDVYALMSTDSFTPRAEQVLYENCATDLTRILEAADD